ncbi:MAG: hypothetical protein RLP15_13035 [Cryomorphaceae bacterium]
MRSLLGIFLAFSLLNLSIEIWNTPILLAEINEEIEHIVEGPVASDAFTSSDDSLISASGRSLNNYRNLHLDEFAQSCDFFEIDSPPPEIG